MKTPTLTIAEQILLNVEQEKQRQEIEYKKQLDEAQARLNDAVKHCLDNVPREVIEYRLRNSKELVTTIRFGSSFMRPSHLSLLEQTVRDMFKDEGFIGIHGYYDEGSYGIAFEVAG